MRAVGPYAEFMEQRNHRRYPALRDFVRDHPEEDQDWIIRYLVYGHIFMAPMGLRSDVLFKGPTDVMANANTYGLQTDGEWMWDGDLWYYVETYNIALPGDFLEWIRSRDYVVSNVTGNQLISILDSLACMSMISTEADDARQFVAIHLGESPRNTVSRYFYCVDRCKEGRVLKAHDHAKFRMADLSDVKLKEKFVELLLELAESAVESSPELVQAVRCIVTDLFEGDGQVPAEVCDAVKSVAARVVVRP